MQQYESTYKCDAFRITKQQSPVGRISTVPKWNNPPTISKMETTE